MGINCSWTWERDGLDQVECLYQLLTNLHKDSEKMRWLLRDDYNSFLTCMHVYPALTDGWNLCFRTNTETTLQIILEVSLAISAPALACLDMHSCVQLITRNSFDRRIITQPQPMQLTGQENVNVWNTTQHPIWGRWFSLAECSNFFCQLFKLFILKTSAFYSNE